MRLTTMNLRHMGVLISCHNKRSELVGLFEDYVSNESKRERDAIRVPMYRSNSNGSISSDCTIYFYEWSNIFSNPKVFYTTKSFYEFVAKSNIHLEGCDVVKLSSKCSGVFHITCVKYKTSIIIARSWTELKELTK